MKVILLKNVKGIGRANETVEVADGYALNLLIPQKAAIVATAGAVKSASGRKISEESNKEIGAQLIKQNFETLAEARIVIRTKVNEKGHLYDAVAASEIVEAAKRDAGVEIPEDAIKLEKPIKEVGTFEVPIAFGENFGKFSIIIEGEE